MSISGALRQRWVTTQGRELLSGVVRWLAGGPRPPGLSDHEGRADLRGLRLPEPAIIRDIAVDSLTFQVIEGMVQVRGATWSSLDLGYAQLPSVRFFDSLVQDCNFEESSCRDWRLWGTEVSGSTFRKADLRAAVLGTWHDEKPNLWREVSFDGADLRKMLMCGSVLTGCTFRDALLEGAKFQQSAMQGCVFAGDLVRVLFDGRDLPGEPSPGALRGLDFSKASLEQVEFRGCRFDDVRMPDTADVWVVPEFPAVARRALDLVADDQRLEARRLASQLRNALRMPGSDDSVGVFNWADYRALGGDSFAEFAETVLRQASASPPRAIT